MEENSVAQKLQTLRFQDIRRQTNSSGRRIPSSTRFTFNDPSLPATSVGTAVAVGDLTVLRSQPRPRFRPRHAGLVVAPPSWTNPNATTATQRADPGILQDRARPTTSFTSRSHLQREPISSALERHQAFSLGWSYDRRPTPLFPSLGSNQGVPSLLQFTVQALFSSVEDLADAISWAPPHLLCLISRHAAAHHPEYYTQLTTADIEQASNDFKSSPPPLSFFYIASGTTGEVNYVNIDPKARLLRGYLEYYAQAIEEQSRESWDDEIIVPPSLAISYKPMLLESLNLLSLSLAAFSDLIPLIPPTVTRLSLMALWSPALTPNPHLIRNRLLAKLARKLPYLHFLDFSYTPPSLVAEMVTALDWKTSFHSLTSIGLRQASKTIGSGNEEEIECAQPTPFIFLSDEADFEALFHQTNFDQDWHDVIEDVRRIWVAVNAQRLPDEPIKVVV